LLIEGKALINILGDDPRDGGIKKFEKAIQSYGDAIKDEILRLRFGIPTCATALI